MNILDKLLRRPEKKVQPVETVTIPEQQTEQKGNLDLSKKIGLNFSKLNLDKEDVRKKRIFVLDVSGSMAERIKGKRKIDSLKEVMSKYIDAKMIAFSYYVEDVGSSSDIPEPNGGTNLAGALTYINNMDIHPERIVLVSDGEPDSKVDAFGEAKKLGLPIDIIFIGQEGSSHEEFMKDIAKKTGGEQFTV